MIVTIGGCKIVSQLKIAYRDFLKRLKILKCFDINLCNTKLISGLFKKSLSMIFLGETNHESIL